jgi:hypothetical protein
MGRADYGHVIVRLHQTRRSMAYGPMRRLPEWRRIIFIAPEKAQVFSDMSNWQGGLENPPSFQKRFRVICRSRRKYEESRIPAIWR